MSLYRCVKNNRNGLYNTCAHSVRATRPSPARWYSTDHGKHDPRLKDLGKQIYDEYAVIKGHYATPKHPIVLAHGLLGFAELQVVGGWLPTIQYWRGISDALEANGIQVITATVPPSGSIQQRAEKLAHGIAQVAQGKSVNIIAHSMGGLDARYMISHLQPNNVDVRSLVTVASPHRGSAFADYLLKEIGTDRLPSVYKFVEGVGMDTGAFEQLTRQYMTEEFNPQTPDDSSVRYFSYGATIDQPSVFSPFRHSQKIITDLEGPNDGLVSVASSKWGTYKGTLVGVSHLDLINWTNRLRWTMRKWMGQGPSFNAIAFYLDIADMLAREDL
ncbi:alpha/beta-hydrolase [Annulohypoxylon maeteangense]|uniref:alpha/beta-hydrolase n=1 Tax=Annulohypoxylon maeteangense TaxID=1927788 RepID=UPI0020075254|nr:alpha/beta-hydrolase [Annulohypoxylon maeteangense]KAI0881830.1 alpha/beta-hydrolase [Annulohypoxylon maeteangense]